MIPEKENEALMRLHMCAMDMCEVCKYENDDVKSCRARASENASILFEALNKQDEPQHSREDIFNKIMKAFAEDANWLLDHGTYTLGVVNAMQRASDILKKVNSELIEPHICGTCEYLKKHNGELADYVCSIRGAVVNDPSSKDCDEMWKPRKE